MSVREHQRTRAKRDLLAEVMAATGATGTVTDDDIWPTEFAEPLNLDRDADGVIRCRHCGSPSLRWEPARVSCLLCAREAFINQQHASAVTRQGRIDSWLHPTSLECRRTVYKPEKR